MKRPLSLCLLTGFASALVAQTPRVVVLDMRLDNSLTYYFDVADPAKRGIDPGPTTVDMSKVGAFNQTCQIDDIVEVNGKPAKGIHFTCAYRMNFSPNPQPGQTLADAAFSNAWPNCNWELLSKDGRFIGRLVDGGFFPHSILGGAGAFFGARGEHYSTSIRSGRAASVAEDPSMRRTHPGTGSYRVQYYLVPLYYPEVETTAQGPSVFHGADFSPVTPARPARAGETLIVRAKNLGPTTPSTFPGQAFPKFTGEPLPEVNSDVEVSVGGNQAEVLLKAGWPGEVGIYRVDFRMPAVAAPGTAALQLTAAWIPSAEVPIAVQ
ncbi:MAG: hypothetical protein M1541_08910 [Acidobacteria bacterium]|nr:hypothetical protein [Acidobacteriota bacterium]